MAQTVIENKLYADLLNPIIDNSNLYPFKEIMGRVNIAGTNYRFDGQRSIIIRNLIAGKDVNADLQNYTANETQKWSNAEKTLTVRYSRKYRDFVAREYEVTGKPLNTAANVMAEYERTGRPETISSQYAENLYNIAKDNGTLFTDAISTPEEAKAMFDKMNEARLENSNSAAIFYCTAKVKGLLKDYIATSRRWSNDNTISYDVEVIDDVQIKVVPAKYLKSKYTKTLGYTPAGDAVQINAVMVTIDTIISPFILDDIYIDEPSALSDGKAFLLNQFAFDLWVHPSAANYGVFVAADAA